MTSFTTEQVLAWRLQRHQLHERGAATDLLDLVDQIGGLHAQLMSSAELSLWARLDGVTTETVSQALWGDRTLVKTWAMRGTLHLLPASGYPSWQAALSTYRHYLRPVWLKSFGITREELTQLIDTVDQVLRNRVLTRDELATEVARVTGAGHLAEKLLHSWGSSLKPAAFQGKLIFGPSRGQNVGFTNPASWIELGPARDPEEANAQLLRRFLRAYGPATKEDFSRWSGHTPADSGKLVKQLGDELTAVEVDGRRVLALSDELPDIQVAGLARTVNLLPAFDPWIIGASRDVSDLNGGMRKPRIYRPQGWISPVILVNGRMAGVWKHEKKGSRVLVTLEPFAPLPAWARKGAEQAAERLAAYFGGKPDVAWLAPT